MSSRSQEFPEDSPRPNDRLRCQACGRTFTRVEHLKRHELIHSNDRPFQCNTCGRDFVRKDALDRHHTTHLLTGPTLRQKGTRACLNCASSKVRCSGELPTCSRCRGRGENECVYPSMAPSQDANSTTFDQTHPVLASNMSLAVIGSPQTPTSSNVGIDPTSRAEAGARPSAPGPPAMPRQDEAYWAPDFQPTINWLSDDFSFLTSDMNFDDLNDSILFPYMNAPLQDSAVLDSPSVQRHHMMVPSMHLSQDLAVVDSPLHTSQISLSPVSTTRSGASSRANQPRVEGELYVDGQPARLPRVKRRRLTTSTFVSTPSKISTFSMTIDANSVQVDDTCSTRLSDVVYDQMKSAFYEICAGAQCETHASGQKPPCWSVFSTRFEPGFPSKHVFEGLLSLYVTSFQHILPLFHSTSFERLPWQLTVMVCALSGRYLASTVENIHFAASMHEFARRILYVGREDQTWLPTDSMEYAQLTLLYTINTAYSSTMHEEKDKTLNEDLPVAYCKSSWNKRAGVAQSSDVSEAAWEAWKRLEMEIRVGYGIWLVDCMLAVHLQQKPMLTLDDVACPLPCHEELWQAESANEWLKLRPCFPPTSTMSDALHELYVQKKLSRFTGEFSRILLIHGLFHRMWEVQSYFSNPLSQWTPTAHNPTDAVATLDGSIWLPSLPIFSRWRNASCDCIDILHWNANATIGAASGMEHPTVLHLHMSRVVILTPYKHIVSIAKYLVGKETIQPNTGAAFEKQIVRRWAVQDQYKARLAMIHAGVLLWHVRRYSANGFYEPASVAMATLALWAFSVFSEKNNSPSQADEQRASNDGSESEEARCDIILLDRPTDDELVQQYVKEGHRMSAILKGVGDLCGANGPERVLIEGRKLLKTLNLWGVSEYWISLFSKLIVISRRPRDLSNGEKD